ncbi:MAG: hypothetical protein DIJKHBIC_04719 [Thermoanaerobaculia bacterium]|nr:hypothetical protein [Thermoanaerobaculia bacterium]
MDGSLDKSPTVMELVHGEQAGRKSRMRLRFWPRFTWAGENRAVKEPADTGTVAIAVRASTLPASGSTCASTRTSDIRSSRLPGEGGTRGNEKGGEITPLPGL